MHTVNFLLILFFTLLVIYLYGLLDRGAQLCLTEKLLIFAIFLLITLVTVDLKIRIDLMTIAMILAVTSFYDLRYFEIPNSTHFLLFLCAVLLKALSMSKIFCSLVIVTVMAGIESVFAFATGKEGIGYGDLKLYSVLFLFLDLYRCVFLICLSCIYGLVIMFVKNRSYIAFCPAISLAMITVLLL